MPNPQQPGLRRSGLTDTTQDAWDSKATSEPPAESGNAGPVPEENRPGHHPEAEQDRPPELGGAGHGGS